ncbi:hypothetical protein CFO_g4095 [Ceratocystis platani]|uniref:Uncharacterized protein n=1 Tax=Ceratocystis fimbriata f. sp. platani TaxID=88771 RepID=A0A0F8AYV8_CERFI|nr:hypothetical protein CFO_g4095 [Ceratocystis platani]
MKFSVYSLSLGFYLFGAAQADILDDNNYDVIQMQPQKYAVFSPESDEMRSQMSIFSFYPDEKISTVMPAKKDEEALDDPELSLMQIYDALLKRAGMTFDEMRWLMFDMDKNEETSKISATIRQARGLDPNAQVEILPGDQEWRTLMQSEYYELALLIAGKKADRIVLRVKESPDWWKGISLEDRIQFFFSPSDDEMSTSGDGDEPYWLSSEKETALFSSIEKQEAETWAGYFMRGVDEMLSDVAV